MKLESVGDETTNLRKLEQGKGKAQCVTQTTSKTLETLGLQSGDGQGRRSIKRNAYVCPQLLKTRIKLIDDHNS